MSETKLTVKDVLGDAPKKQIYRNTRFVFKCDEFSVESDARYERLNAKKILPFEEYDCDKTTGVRVKAKLVGYNRGEKRYFKAIQNTKGTWIADTDTPVAPELVHKVIKDKRTGEKTKKDTNKGMWFSKCVPAGIVNDWHIEDTYNIWTEENSDNLLKVYEYLIERGEVGVFKFNPNGTAYNGFLVPQRVDGTRFRLLLKVCRVKINKPEVSATMSIQEAKAREREKSRQEQIGVASMLEEI